MTSDGGMSPSTSTGQEFHVEHAAPAPIAPRVGPVRRTFTAPWVRTFETPTCAECGTAPAQVLVEWPPHYATIERDGKRFDACERCARRDRAFANAKPSQIITRAAARRLDERVLEAVERRPGATVIALCIDLELLPEGAERSRENREVTDRVKDSLRRLVALRRVQKRRRKRCARFWPRAAPSTPRRVR